MRAGTSLYRRVFKRWIDIGGSAAGLAVGSPLLIAVAVAIKTTSRGPLIYVQQRVGLNGETFDILKFRSMRILEHSVRPDGTPMSNEERVTRVGALLRRSGLDEVPQLINILRGDMSIVGPRPTLQYQVERYDERQRGRLAVRPGLTGLAQVTGRNTLAWDEKIDLDLEYVRLCSLGHDISIICRTVQVVLRGEGVSFQKFDPLSEHDDEYWKDI